MRTYYQVYRDQYWHTSTLDKSEAFAIAANLRARGHNAEVRVMGQKVAQ